MATKEQNEFEAAEVKLIKASQARIEPAGAVLKTALEAANAARDGMDAVLAKFTSRSALVGTAAASVESWKNQLGSFGSQITSMQQQYEAINSQYTAALTTYEDGETVA